MTSSTRLQNAGVPDGSVERLMIEEFFSAPANQHVRFADHRRKSLRYQLKQAIAGRMAVQIIHLLEEIHIDHDENQVAMIHLADLNAAGALIISQHLACLRR